MFVLLFICDAVMLSILHMHEFVFIAKDVHLINSFLDLLIEHVFLTNSGRIILRSPCNEEWHSVLTNKGTALARQ